MKPRKPLARRQGFKARPKPLKRTPIKRVSDKRKKADAAVRVTKRTWLAEHESCSLCHWFPGTKGRYGRQLHLHHLAGGSSRKDIPENWLRLCSSCHSNHHDGGHYFDNGEPMPDITDGVLLSAKQESDPSYYNVETLAAIRGWAALPYEPEPIPAAFERERELNILGS